MRRYAFTLIEILLVIAILSVLTGIVFAAFGPARESARVRVCVSNLHQIGKAFALYIADYDGIDPVLGVRTSPRILGLPGTAEAGRVFFADYIKSEGILRCPSFHETEASGAKNSYRWPGLLDEESVPELDLPNLVAKRGLDYVLAACYQHNSNLDFDNQPRWNNKKVIVLRLNQQVQVKHVPARQFGAFSW